MYLILLGAGVDLQGKVRSGKVASKDSPRLKIVGDGCVYVCMYVGTYTLTRQHA